MAKKFQELVKNFETIRRYTRDFYIYGFKERDDFSYGSQRGYDNERRRIESYLAHWIAAETVYGKKRVRLEFNPNQHRTNPLNQIWKAKSFTKNDIFLHFVLLDCLDDKEPLSVQNILERMDDEYLSFFSDDYFLDSLTIRKKLKEYVVLGLVNESQAGRERLYSRNPVLTIPEEAKTAIQFYREVFPVGILGDYLLQEQKAAASPFLFKHVFPVQTLDSHIMLQLLEAIHLRRMVSFSTGKQDFNEFTPIKICSSCESGRQYLIGHTSGKSHLYSIRLNAISEVKLGTPATKFEHFQLQYEEQKKVTWNAAFTARKNQTLHVYLEINEETEDYLIRRLEKEKRQGTIKKTDKDEFLFSIQLSDMTAITPFLRTFFGRIKRMQCSNRSWEKRFWQDYQKLYELYVGEEEK